MPRESGRPLQRVRAHLGDAGSWRPASLADVAADGAARMRAGRRDERADDGRGSEGEPNGPDGERTCHGRHCCCGFGCIREMIVPLFMIPFGSNACFSVSSSVERRAVLLLDPRRPRLADPVVVDDRAAARERLLADDRDDREVVLRHLLLGRAVDEVVEVVEVHVGAVDVAVRRVPARHRDVGDLGEDARQGALVDVVDRAPVGGDLGRAVDVARRPDALVLGGDLLRSPDEVVEPGRDQAAVDGPALGIAGDDLGDARRRRLRDPGRALGHEQQHAVVRLGEVGEVQPAVARVVEPRHRRVVAAHHHLAQRLEAGLHVLAASSRGTRCSRAGTGRASPSPR